MLVAQVTANHQLAIPQDILQRLNLHVGDKLKVNIKENTLTLEPVMDKSVQDNLAFIEKYAGIGAILHNKNNPNATVEEIREDRDSWRF